MADKVSREELKRLFNTERALNQQLAAEMKTVTEERDAAQALVKTKSALFLQAFDEHHTTPSAQARHKLEVEALKTEIAGLRAAVAPEVTDELINAGSEAFVISRDIDNKNEKHIRVHMRRALAAVFAHLGGRPA